MTRRADSCRWADRSLGQLDGSAPGDRAMVIDSFGRQPQARSVANPVHRHGSRSLP